MPQWGPLYAYYAFALLGQGLPLMAIGSPQRSFMLQTTIATRLHTFKFHVEH
jgi:hypothetical protein